MRKFIFVGCFFTSSVLQAQPYLDIARFNYSYTPESGVNKKRVPLESHIFSINVNFPLELKKGGDAFIINPFFDHNEGQVSNTDFHVVSQGLLVGFLKKDFLPKWDVLSSFVVRRSKQAEMKVADEWQYGGFILTTWCLNPLMSWTKLEK